MIGKLYNALSIVSIATLLALVGLGGLLVGSGRLTSERSEKIAAVLRGEMDEPAEEEVVEADAEQPESKPKRIVSGASSEELRRQRRDDQLRRALGERAYSDLVARKELLDQSLQHLISEEERFTADKVAWREELDRRQGAAQDAGFKKELKIVTKLPAKLAKEHVLLKWKDSPADTLRLFVALPESNSKRIFEQMKTPEEIQVMHELLELLGRQEADELATRSGTTAGN